MAKSLTFIDVLRFAAGYWRRQPVKLGATLTLFIVAALLETYLPTALANFLGAVQRVGTQHAVITGLAIFLGVYFLQSAISSLTFFIYNAFETHVFKMIVDDAFAHVYRLPEHFFVNTFTGSIITRISRGRRQMEIFEDQMIIQIFPTLVVLLGTTGFLALRFPVLAALMIAYLLIVVIASIALVLRISGPAQALYAKSQDVFGANLADNIGGIATTKSYAQENFETARFFELTGRLQEDNLRAYWYSGYAGLMQRVMMVGMLVLLLGGGTWYFLHGKTSAENIAYLAFAHTIMQSYIRQIGENVTKLLTASYDLHGLIDLINEEPEMAVEAEANPLEIQAGAIAFEKVTFTYPGKTTPIFRDLSVSIRAGERIALVGHSGSGKTTFVRLLQCLYPIDDGHISIDGQNITHGSRSSLRSAIALVPQDPILFHRSLRENIAYAKPDASLDDIKSAARQANIGAFIDGLPLGYDTLVGERGIKLSGGERQRIAIARAILADRPILVLDEATSSLDSESERAIQDALHALTTGRTSIMIAHRLSTIMEADRILVFDKGRIAEEGTHAELVAMEGGIYAHLFELQSGGFIE